MKRNILFFVGILTAIQVFAFKYTYEGNALSYGVHGDGEKYDTCFIAKQSDPITGDLIIPGQAFFSGNNKYYTVTSITIKAFSDYKDITSVVIPNTVTSIGTSAFSDCSSIATIEIPSSISTIYYGTFKGCSSLKSVEIPNSVTSIGQYAFSNCSAITDIQLPSSISHIGSEAFKGCSSLKSIILPDNISIISSSTFAQCSNLKSVVIPNSVTEIGKRAFDRCYELEAIDIPNSVTSIGQYAFSTCSSLTSVIIPKDIEKIFEKAFFNCSKLTSVYYDSNDPITAGSSVFEDCPLNEATLYVPESSVEKCKQIYPWKLFKNIQAFDFQSGEIETEINPENDLPCQIYTLEGINAGSVLNNLAPGIYIVRQGSKVKKIAVK